MNDLNFKHHNQPFHLKYYVVLLIFWLLPVLPTQASEGINQQNTLTLPPPMPVPYYLNLANGEYDKMIARAKKNFIMANCQSQNYWPLVSSAYNAQLVQDLLNTQSKFSQQNYLQTRIKLLNERFRYDQERKFLLTELQHLLHTTTPQQSISYSAWFQKGLVEEVAQFNKLNAEFQATKPWWNWQQWPSNSECQKWANHSENKKPTYNVQLYITNNGSGKAIIMDDFFVLLLEQQIDQHLSQGDVQSAAKIWPSILRFELLDAVMWEDEIKLHINEYLGFIEHFNLDKVLALELAQSRMLAIPDINHYPKDKAIQQQSIAYLLQQAARKKPAVPSEKQKHRARCYQGSTPCLTLWQLYRQDY